MLRKTFQNCEILHVAFKVLWKVHVRQTSPNFYQFYMLFRKLVLQKVLMSKDATFSAQLVTVSYSQVFLP